MKARRRNIRRFKELAPDQRRNSQSIRRMLFDIIAHRYQASVDKASISFSAALKQARDKRAYHRGMSAENLYRTTLDHHFFTYSQLDAMAQVHRIPLSLLLVFTRVRSELESMDRRKANEAQRIIAAFRDALDHLDNQVMKAGRQDADIYELLDYRAFEEFVSVYLDKFDETFL